jgi:hypothetical protein
VACLHVERITLSKLLLFRYYKPVDLIVHISKLQNLSDFFIFMQPTIYKEFHVKIVHPSRIHHWLYQDSFDTIKYDFLNFKNKELSASICLLLGKFQKYAGRITSAKVYNSYS